MLAVWPGVRRAGVPPPSPPNAEPGADACEGVPMAVPRPEL